VEEIVRLERATDLWRVGDVMRLLVILGTLVEDQGLDVCRK
jgi:hypothetical protein